MNEKYGEAKFALASELVARWLNNCGQNEWTAEDIIEMCKADEYVFKIFAAEAEQLRKLFGLKNIEELYNN
ncbi:MAG TPA: hypothetical protein PL045_03690 [Chitinophagaceae bacterium]|nr:hypothetical protein [Chitinophagaceae bacterium]